MLDIVRQHVLERFHPCELGLVSRPGRRCLRRSIMIAAAITRTWPISTWATWTAIRIRISLLSATLRPLCSGRWPSTSTRRAKTRWSCCRPAGRNGYVVGDPIEVQVYFGFPISVTGTPRLAAASRRARRLCKLRAAGSGTPRSASVTPSRRRMSTWTACSLRATSSTATAGTLTDPLGGRDRPGVPQPGVQRRNRQRSRTAGPDDQPPGRDPHRRVPEIRRQFRRGRHRRGHGRLRRHHECRRPRRVPPSFPSAARAASTR